MKRDHQELTFDEFNCYYYFFKHIFNFRLNKMAVLSHVKDLKLLSRCKTILNMKM